MAQTTRTLILIAVLGSASACHSMARIRMHQCVRTESQAVTLDLMIDAPGPVLSSPSMPVVDVVIPLLLYPIEKSISFCVAVWAPFDPDLDIRWGPVGALAGITLPWVTLIPYLLPPNRLADVDLDPQVFDELRQRVHEGDGVDAYIELVQRCGWPGGPDALHSVRLHDGGRTLKGGCDTATAGGPPPPVGGAPASR